MARSRVVLGVVLGALVVAACSSTSPGSPTAQPGEPTPVQTSGASAAATATTGPASTAPANFQLTVSGDLNVTGTWGASFGIDCNNPTLTGEDILFFAMSPDGKAVVLITLRANSVGVSERAGSGATYTDREFSGTGVTSFDPARGGSFDSDVTIVPNPGSKSGTLGTITHVAGSIGCGNQTAGTSTLVASGASAEEPIDGSFTATRVTCTASVQNGNNVNVVAVLGTATPPVLMIINFPANFPSTIVTITSTPSKQHQYQWDKAGTVTATATGAHVDATFVEVLPAGDTSTPHMIHLAGDVTCGIFNNS